MERVEDGGGGGAASAEFAGEVEGVGDSEAGEVRAEKQEARRQGSKDKDNAYFKTKTECDCGSDC